MYWLRKEEKEVNLSSNPVNVFINKEFVLLLCLQIKQNNEGMDQTPLMIVMQYLLV